MQAGIARRILQAVTVNGTTPSRNGSECERNVYEMFQDHKGENGFFYFHKWVIVTDILKITLKTGLVHRTRET
jgi:hypothetical protein